MTVASAVRSPTHEQDAAHVAFLVETARQRDFEQAIEEVAAAGRGAHIRLLGPMAPYDFVASPSPGEES